MTERQKIAIAELAVDAEVLSEFAAVIGPDGPVVLGQIVETYLVEAPQTITALRTALTQGDATAAARLAHRLKGSSLSIGARQLALRCAELEMCCETGAPPSPAVCVELAAICAETAMALRAMLASLSH